MRGVKDKCRQLEENHRTMKRKVNPKVLSMIDRCVASSSFFFFLDADESVQLTLVTVVRSVEKKERDLLAMHKQVLKDKVKIEETVAVLDEHKRETLEKTWDKVNACVSLR